MFKETYMIKLFEEYNQYYFEITIEEFVSDRNISNKYHLLFSKSELDSLRKVYNVADSLNSDRSFTPSLMIHKDNIVATIYKLPDEWYITRIIYMDDDSQVRYIGGTFYKCDQIEGLLKCLKRLI